MVRVVSGLLAVAILSGCFPHGPRLGEPRAQELTLGTARFRIVYFPEDAAAARQVRSALEVAVPHLARWGGLRHPVTIRIHPTHEALEFAVGREGYDWLRAWAKFETIDVQSPRTWGLFGARARDLEELFTHELTHCVMYQLAGGELTWMYKEIPRWFSEGLATLTARQAYRYAPLEELYEFYEKSAGGAGYGDPSGARRSVAMMAQFGDPIVDPDPIYQDQWRIVYGAAHHAAEFLVARYGEGRVMEVMRLMGTGLRFPTAFQQAVGLTDGEFASDFRRFVVWQGWRRED